MPTLVSYLETTDDGMWTGHNMVSEGAEVNTSTYPNEYTGMYDTPLGCALALGGGYSESPHSIEIQHFGHLLVVKFIYGGVPFAALFWLLQTSDHRKIEVELDVKLRSNWT